MNVFSRLLTLLPASTVLIGRVIEIHEDDDTSTVQLPLGIGLSSYPGGVAAGSLIRPRGTTVPVGSNAFVRAGVIESQAPDGDPIMIEVGTVVAEPLGPQGLQFVGPLGPLTASVGVAWELDLAAPFGGYYRPLTTTLLAGTLPAGLVLDGTANKITGTPVTPGTAGGLVVQATDATGRTARTGAFDVIVGA
jgi:hypothetical protein